MTVPCVEAMRAAWLSLMDLPACREWPADYEAVMADPVRGRLVRLQATFLARISAKKAATELPPPAPLIALRPLCFDRKRAAAGDLDD